jgi:hypothetical protein
LLLCLPVLIQNCLIAQVGKEFVDEDEENGEGKLYFTGTGYTINLIPQAIILGVLAFRKLLFSRHFFPARPF